MSVRGWVQGCVWRPQGSELTADAAVGATTLTVDDPTDFDDDGGVLDLNGTQLTYSTIDEDGDVTLDDPLATAGSTGDKVLAISGGQPLSDLILTVSADDGDAIEVSVPFEQRSVWPEGDYDAPVQVVLSDDLERIKEVPGRVPVITGTMITTGTGADDVEITPGSDDVPSAVTFRSNGAYYDDTSPATLSCYDYVVTESSITYDRVQMTLQGAKFLGSGTRPRIEITTSRSQADGFIASLVRHYAVAHEFYVSGTLRMQIAGSTVILPGATALQMGSGDIITGGAVHGADVYVDSQPTTASAANTFMGSSGRLQKSTSSRRYKNDIADAEIDVEAVLRLMPRTFTLKNDESDEPRVYVGFIAEEAEELGLSKWVERDDEGRVDQFAYAQFCVAQQAVLQQQATELDELKAAVAELRTLITHKES